MVAFVSHQDQIELPAHQRGVRTWRMQIDGLPINPSLVQTLNEVEEVDDYNALVKTLVDMPRAYQSAVATRYLWIRQQPLKTADEARNTKKETPRIAGNRYLRSVNEQLKALEKQSSMAWNVVASEEKTKQHAERMALAALQVTTAYAEKLNGEEEENLNALYQYLSEWIKEITCNTVFMPSSKADDKTTGMYSAILRLHTDEWWIRKMKAFRREQLFKLDVALQQVGQKSAYSSRRAQMEFKARQRASNDWLESMELENENGEIINLIEVANSSQANPEIRRNELMLRIRETEEYADDAGDVGMFYTVTAPSRMHRNSSKWDGTYPRQVQEYLTHVWGLVRSSLQRRGIHYYGVRVAEPHKDATPHWHLLLFVKPEHRHTLTKTIRRYYCREDAQELLSRCDAASRRKIIKAYRRANQAWGYKTKQSKGQVKYKKPQKPTVFGPRFDAVTIDKSVGSAAAYIAKYIAKNIDGHGLGNEIDEETGLPLDRGANPVRTWSSDLRIRQFQFQGSPSVTVWRELRRAKEIEFDVAFIKIHKAADEGNWKEFVRLMGGMCVGRNAKFKTAYEDGEVNQYAEPTKKIQGVKYSPTAEDQESVCKKFMSSNLEKMLGLVSDEQFYIDDDTRTLLTRPHTWVMRRKGKQIDIPNSGAGSVGVANLSWTSGNNCTPLSSVENKGGRSELLTLAADKDQQVEKALQEQRFDAWEIDLLLRGSRVSDGMHTYYLDRSGKNVELRSIDESKSDKGKELEWTIEIQRRRAAGTETFLEDIPEW